MSPAPVFVRIPGSHHPGSRLRLVPGFRDPGSVLILGQVTQYGDPYLICITLVKGLMFIQINEKYGTVVRSSCLLQHDHIENRWSVVVFAIVYISYAGLSCDSCWGYHEYFQPTTQYHVCEVGGVYGLDSSTVIRYAYLNRSSGLTWCLNWS